MKKLIISVILLNTACIALYGGQESEINATSKEQVRLGLCYVQGINIYDKSKSTPPDYNEAVKWFRKAAYQEDSAGQYLLGKCYLFGKGVDRDATEAIKWLRKSASQGNSTGQAFYGVCYSDGSGVQRDYKEAFKWFSRSANQGDALGQYLMGKCYLDGKGVDRDQTEAIKWLRKSANQGLDGAKVALDNINKSL